MVHDIVLPTWIYAQQFFPNLHFELVELHVGQQPWQIFQGNGVVPVLIRQDMYHRSFTYAIMTIILNMD